MGEWLDDLEAKVEAGERSPRYIENLRAWANPKSQRPYFVPLFSRSIHEIDFNLIRKWQRELTRHGVRPPTVKHATEGLSAFLGWLVKAGQLPTKPPIPWPSVDRHTPTIIRPEHQNAILEAVPAPERGAFLAMALLGLRHSEAWVIDGRDVRDGRLWIRSARKGKRLGDPIRKPKNRQAKVLPIPKPLAAWMDVYVPKERLLRGGPIFVNPRTERPWSPTSFRRAYLRAVKVAGLDHLRVCSYEAFKHSTATEWLRQGASEREVMELLGHRERRSVEAYTVLANERLTQIVESRGASGSTREQRDSEKK